MALPSTRKVDHVIKLPVASGPAIWVSSRREALWFIEAPIEGESFRLYVEKVLRRFILAIS